MTIKHDKYLIVISIDALNALDYDYIKTLPTFKSFITEGSTIRNMLSVYPSLTYPCHTSITTGTYPNRHGIVANKRCQPERYLHEEWYWYKKYIKVPTIFDHAMRQGFTCGAIMWPVMGGADITYNVPEIWPVRPENFLKTYMDSSSKNLILPILKHLKLRKKLQPTLDNFTENMTHYLIKNKQPHLLFIHFTELDFARHKLGLHTSKVKEILKRMDQRLAKIISSTKKANIYDKTSFMVLGDHGTNDYNNYICMNSIFKKKGLIYTNNKNNILYWKAFANSCGGSAQVCIRPRQDKTLFKKVYTLLTDLCTNPVNGIKHLYTSQETNRLFHLDGDFRFVLEAEDGYAFKNNICDELVVSRSLFPRSQVADHGFEPCHPNMRTMLLAKGRGIPQKINIAKARVVDMAPTMARLMGIPMFDMDGACVTSLIDVTV